MSAMKCPHCGGKIALAAVAADDIRAVQTELALAIPLRRVTSKKKRSERVTSAQRFLTEGVQSDTRALSAGKDYSLLDECNDPRKKASSKFQQNLFEQVRLITGDGETRKNRGMWWQRIYHCPKAVANAIEDWKLLSPQKRTAVRNRAAWLTDRYVRALVEIGRKVA
jgi:hypothetical protein